MATYCSSILLEFIVSLEEFNNAAVVYCDTCVIHDCDAVTNISNVVSNVIAYIIDIYRCAANIAELCPRNRVKHA